MACNNRFFRRGLDKSARQPSLLLAPQRQTKMSGALKRKRSKLFVQVPQSSRLRAVAGREWNISICFLG